MRKKLSALLAALVLMLTLVPAGPSASAATAGITAHVTVKGFDPKVDYMREMQKALQDGGEYALQMGAIYEQQRNLKIDATGAKAQKTSYFTTYKTAGDILKAMEEDKKPQYSEEDLYWLSRVISAEAGSTWIPDWVQRGVGSVVLNRVKSPRFADTVKDVVFQAGQYHCVTNGAIYNTPRQQAVDNAVYLLENGSTMPDGVLGQSQFVQGTIHATYYDQYLGTTTYFCYM